ncbi:hypothetical protein A2U01_0072900, partial [Trifolium medium]|nr:hypothetical protein [Trifolium medium]
MASASQINNDGDDFTAAIQNSPQREENAVLFPVHNTDKVTTETDPRDGQETSWTSKDGDVPVLTER